MLNLSDSFSTWSKIFKYDSDESVHIALLYIFFIFMWTFSMIYFFKFFAEIKNCLNANLNNHFLVIIYKLNDII